MKRGDLIRWLESQGCEFQREATRHTRYWNPLNGQFTTISRHAEVSNAHARKVCKDLGVDDPWQQ